MFDKKRYYHTLKKAVDEAEHNYDVALNNLELAFSRINKGVIHGKKEEGTINTLKSVVSAFSKASFDYELASHRLSLFLKNGVIKYE